MKIVLCTRNQEKIRIMKAHLNQAGHEIMSLDDADGDPPEIPREGSTFSENARVEALAVAKWSGLVALAESSGLVVDALGGEPGVESSAYAGEDSDIETNMAHLLAKMEKVPGNERQAHYTCALCLASPDGRTWEAEGSAHGMITTQMKGPAGSDYEQVFFFPNAGATFAEMPPLIKNRVSHLFHALNDLARTLPGIEKKLGGKD
ncbi:MAG: non-canonical purine NTP pyrophosphatase [bacterium]